MASLIERYTWIIASFKQSGVFIGITVFFIQEYNTHYSMH
jgi:hypothetical protein